MLNEIKKRALIYIVFVTFCATCVISFKEAMRMFYTYELNNNIFRSIYIISFIIGMIATKNVKEAKDKFLLVLDLEIKFSSLVVLTIITYFLVFGVFTFTFLTGIIWISLPAQIFFHLDNYSFLFRHYIFTYSLSAIGSFFHGLLFNTLLTGKKIFIKETPFESYILIIIAMISGTIGYYINI